jgi:hypothetical protein
VLVRLHFPKNAPANGIVGMNMWPQVPHDVGEAPPTRVETPIVQTAKGATAKFRISKAALEQAGTGTSYSNAPIKTVPLFTFDNGKSTPLPQRDSAGKPSLGGWFMAPSDVSKLINP